MFLVPTGDPKGRPTVQKQSDGYGASVFTGLLEGRYDVRVGAVNAPHNEPTQVTVVAIGGERSATVEVPRGFDLGVLVQTIHGWGVENAELMMYEVDTQKFFKYEGKTDYSGKHVFAHISPGSYQLNVTAEGYEYWQRVVKVPEDHAPADTIVRLVPR